MNSSRDEFLSGPAFALDQNIRVRGGDLLNKSEDLLQTVALSDNFRKCILPVELTTQRAILTKKFALLNSVFYRLQQIVVNEWFSYVIVSSLAKSGHSRVDGRVCRHDHNKGIGIDTLDPVEQLDPIHAGHFYVSKGRRDIFLAEYCESRFR